MNILHVSHRDIKHPKAGGLEVVIHEISKRWVGKGHQVSIVCSGYLGGAKEEIVDGIQTWRIGREEFFNLIVGLWLKYKGWLNADVMIEHLGKAACFLPIFSRRPYLLIHVPHLFRETIFEEAFWLLGAYIYILEQVIPAAYSGCPAWVPSKSTMDNLLELGFSQEQIDIIPYGVNKNYFAVERRPSVNPTILYVGRLRKYKGLINPLLKAWAIVLRKYSNAKLQIAGRGDCEDAIRQYVLKNNLRNSVEIVGCVSEQQKIELMRAAWVLVYPSIKEGWGLSIIEAGAMGVPAVASNSHGLRESVHHGKTGLLVPHGDEEALAQAMVYLIKNEPLRLQMGDAAKNWSQNFNWDITATRVLDLMCERFPHLKSY